MSNYKLKVVTMICKVGSIVEALPFKTDDFFGQMYDKHTILVEI